jgi:molybdopterin-guanine dinucleotide biosynthesis protein A
MTAHSKHTSLVRRPNGNHHANEVAIMGLPCGDLKALVYSIINQLADNKIAYLDADHSSEESEINPALKNGAFIGYTNKISHASFDHRDFPKEYEVKRYYDQADMVIANGNHFEAVSQILVLDPRKPLAKKLAKITNPCMVVVTEALSEIPQEVLGKFPDVSRLPTFKITDLKAIVAWFEGQLTPTPMKGLVLAGGKSTRMQRDKSKINYHGMDQVSFVSELLEKQGLTTYISKAKVDDASSDLPALVDTFTDLGPFGAILSAFRTDPNCAWLVVACDLPMLSEETIERLIKNRSTASVATAFHSEASGFPEPLITIWEPKAYPLLLHFLSIGYSCPRKVLINTDVHTILPTSQLELMNANTPEEYEAAKKLIQSKGL